ncbi:MAG TPA: protein kinase [Vicinamibacterales bacterium]|nr:protein kinase [Vicinamibacterales bacterium]
MALPPGARLGPYEIVAPLGAGGMGEVYRAHDGRLNREVAIKILPPAFAQDPDRLRRFEQEAKAAAALSHPNVMAVFDVRIDGDVPYVVSELLEGETLGALIRRGPVPLRKATDLAVQVALGMAAAHQKGIVHRDLKPANIFVTTDGRAKILDFGLARMTEARDADPTRLSAPATNPGAVMGTAGYMAPEQVRGQPVDHRTDIFAFGAVCYELLAGQRAFTGDSDVETMSAILKADPPDVPSGVVPAQLERVVRRCLEKSPAQRFQSASDIAFALEAMSGTLVGTPAVATVPRDGRRWGWAALLAVLILGAAAGALVAWRTVTGPPEPVQFEAKTFDHLPVTNARFMPDGQTVVFSAAPGGQPPELFVISPTAEAPQQLGPNNGHLLAVSSLGELAVILPGSHFVAHFGSGTLARMTIGSSPRPVLDNVRAADWSPDGEAMAIVHDLGNGRDRLEYPGGTVLHEASGYLSDPRVSPDGNRVAFIEHQLVNDTRGRVMVADRSGTVIPRSEVLWAVEGLAWTPDGATLVFSGNVAGGALLQPMAVPASGGGPARTVFGVPGRIIVRDIARDGRWLAVREDLSFGVRAKVPGQDDERELSWLGSSGARSLSADGQWLLMIDVGLRSGLNYGVVLRKTDGSQTVRLGSGSAQDLSPDGKWAAAIIGEPSALLLYPTGAGEPIRIAGKPLDRLISAQWFPDSRQLLLCGSEPSRAPRCYIQDAAGSPPSAVTAEGVLGSVAPDGRTLLLTLVDGSFQMSSIDGGPERPIDALRKEDRLVGWSRDSQAVFVQQGTNVPARVERVDLVDGARTIVRDVTPQGVDGISSIAVTDWVDDGRWYAYNYTILPSTLFVVSGATP